MIKHILKIKQQGIKIIGIILAATLILPTSTCFAENEGSNGVTISPPNQSIIINAGEKYNGSFTISNSTTNFYDFDYKIIAKPFYVNENYDIYYDNPNNMNQIVNWISLDNDSGSLKSGETREIHYTIDVPEDAPAGGQYAAIVVSSKMSETNNPDNNETGTQLRESIGMAYIIYAEISGTTERHGEVLNADLPSFLLSGNITGASSIKNTGNVHGTAKYILQVFPLFSNEEVYTNEESPLESTILPDRTLYNELAWEDTPAVGIFNVIYTVEFEGVTTQVSKLVIVCPIWLLFIIIFAIFTLIFYFVAKAKARKKVTQKANKN